MATVRRNVESANRIVLKIDGVQVGLARNLRPSDDYGLEGQYGIGDIHAQEFSPTQARHSLSLSDVAIKLGSLRSAGIIPENGDAVLQGLEFDILIQDKDTGTVKRKYIGCVYSSGDLDISANQVVSRSAQFMARDVQGTGL